MSGAATVWAAVLGGAACATAAGAWWRGRRREQRARAALRGALTEAGDQRREVARLEAGLEAATAGLILLDERRRIRRWNDAAGTLAGNPPELGAGRLVTSVLAWGPLARALDEVAEAGDGESWRTFECRGQPLEDGSDRSLFVRVQALGEHGYAVAIEDRSRLRQLESVRRDFVANVSHELKTPLAAIKGFVETLIDDAGMPADTRQGFLARIARQTERLDSLVADLLTLSRLDEEGALEHGSCDLAEVVRETLRDLAPLAERSGVTLRPVGVEVAGEVRGGAEALRQVVGNLVDNAIKYTPEGGSVTVRVEPGPERLRVEIVDTGIGLAPEDQRRVFERFYRADRARSRELGGTGLGLSIVKNTVRGLGGEVGVRSALGSGSTFWVTLPRA